jgi:hypothetical protein
MKLSIKKQVTQEEEVEISLPAFFKDCGLFRALNERAELIYIGTGYVSITRPGEIGYDRDVDQTLKCKPCSREEFEARRDKTMAALYENLGMEAVTT